MSTPRDGRSRVAVVGATGCVGSSVCEAAALSGHDVLALARRPAPGAPAAFLPLDVAAAEPVAVADVLRSERITVVVNAAGGWGTTEEEMEYAHVRLVVRLLEAMAAVPGRPRLIHVGSIHEYGPVPDGVAINESVPPQPTTPYARTKLAGSRAVLRAARAGRVDGTVLRAVNVCGPRTSRASFLGALTERMRNAAPGQAVELSIAEARRDYVDVRDLARAVLCAAEAPVTGEVLNIGRGEAVAMRELVTLVAEAAGLGPETIRETDGPVQSKGGGWTRADIRMARRLLGWAPRIGLRESVSAMWEWSAQHAPPEGAPGEA